MNAVDFPVSLLTWPFYLLTQNWYMCFRKNVVIEESLCPLSLYADVLMLHSEYLEMGFWEIRVGGTLGVGPSWWD